MPLPRSSEASARVMPEICHSLVSRYAVIASDARNALLRPVLLASFSRRLLVERPTRTENVVVFICVQYSTEPWLPQAARKAACTGAGTMKFTSRILEGLRACGGFTESWKRRLLLDRREVSGKGSHATDSILVQWGRSRSFSRCFGDCIDTQLWVVSSSRYRNALGKKHSRFRGTESKNGTSQKPTRKSTKGGFEIDTRTDRQGREPSQEGRRGVG